jgi:hypothetical protein
VGGAFAAEGLLLVGGAADEPAAVALVHSHNKIRSVNMFVLRR